ncbi:Flp pilus assembly protein CpaB [Sphingomonas ginkgonis]|uniref:Flp pilus assembly protein CpaB n=1 Tax=Sphingomonas ginkgonis TaxID=2315330 RepID=A0A3R9Z4N9_9SPHN|nr:Flp pilus assembly protein CpaB [Sphingomonas ginkgonis]RST29699.1 Flp pilus assembly protein CpaB [Sphingomonas ginkgonis]
MLRRQSLLALGVAVVLGLVAVYLANTFIAASARQSASAPLGTAKVAVAGVPLDYGSPVTPDKVRFVDFPTASIPPGSFATAASLMPGGKARVALRPMAINEPILASKVSGQGQGASLAALLPDGKRAAAVRINDVSGVAGFVQPNDSVDVLITRQNQGVTAQQVTDVLLQNVRVIAIDQTAKDDNGQPKVGRTATLEVTPVDAQKLALGEQVGGLSLVLRKPGADQDIPGVQTVSLADLRYGLYGPPAQARAIARPLRPRPAAAPRRTVVIRPAAAPREAPTPIQTGSNVQVYRGTTGTQYQVGDYER